MCGRLGHSTNHFHSRSHYTIESMCTIGLCLFILVGTMLFLIKRDSSRHQILYFYYVYASLVLTIDGSFVFGKKKKKKIQKEKQK